MAEIDEAVNLLRERFTAQTQAKLQKLSDEVEKSERNLHALVAEFETRARDERERVDREVEARRRAGPAPSAEPELDIAAVLALNVVLERLPAGDIGPGWKL